MFLGRCVAREARGQAYIIWPQVEVGLYKNKVDNTVVLAVAQMKVSYIAPMSLISSPQQR